MNIDTMRRLARFHFLKACAGPLQKEAIFTEYAKEELQLPEGGLSLFLRRWQNEEPRYVGGPELERFWTWYFINFVVDCVVDDITTRGMPSAPAPNTTAL